MEFQLLVILKRSKCSLPPIQELPHLPIHALPYIYCHILKIIAVEIAIGIETFDQSIDPCLPSLQKFGICYEWFDYPTPLLLEDLHACLFIIGQDLKPPLLQPLHESIRSFLIGCLRVVCILLVDGPQGMGTGD